MKKENEQVRKLLISLHGYPNKKRESKRAYFMPTNIVASCITVALTQKSSCGNIVC